MLLCYPQYYKARIELAGTQVKFGKKKGHVYFYFKNFKKIIKMLQVQNLRSLRHFSRHLFFASRIHIERKKSEQDVFEHLQRMRKAIIRMNLSYSDIDKLKRKIENLIEWERKYAKLFKPEDEESKQLRDQINMLEERLAMEREEKIAAINENNEKIKLLTESLNNIKNQMKHLHLEKAKRHHRLKALEEKIKQRVNLEDYYKK